MGVPLPHIFGAIGVSSPPSHPPGLLCRFLMPLAVQEVSVAGGKKNILLEGFFF